MKKKVNVTSKFTLPSFLKGFASTFDISGQTLLDIPNLGTGFQRDAESLRGDWQRIGVDVRRAMDSFAHD